MTISQRNIYKQKKNQDRIPLPWIAAVVILGLYFLVGSTISDFVSSNRVLSNITGNAKPESLLVYDWKDPELGSMKQHMEFVHMDTDVIPRKQKKYLDINSVHQNGLLHTGAVVAVIDTNVTMDDIKVLLLKRGPQLVTCPNSWSLLGEHTHRDEKPKDTVVRGLKEELGDAFFQQFLKTGANTRPLLKHPVYVKVSYTHNKNDRQMTYLYVIEMNTPMEELQKMMQVDEEVAEVAWMTRQEIQDGWMNYSPHEKFCNHELSILLQLVLHRLEDLEKEANAPKYAAIKAAQENRKAAEEAAASKA